MMFACDYLSEPLDLSEKYIHVLSIENKAVFRKFIKAMLCGEPQEDHFIFSEAYEPVPFKKTILFLHDCYNLSFPSALIKRIYNDLTVFCHDEMPEQTLALKRAISEFMDRINEEFDFDFTFREEVIVQDIFKMQNLRPDTNSESVLESLYAYMVLIQKYAPVKCFVISGLHQNFSSFELETFYKELIAGKIRLLDVESTTDFIPASSEKLTVIDEDLCEIVAKE